ncbi:MAG TPA: DNA-binding protein YbiB [Burkholderiaceae bacterium]
MTEAFAAARFIKEIGRGKKGARSLSRADASMLYEAMLDGRVSDLELGGIMLAMRIKGESVEEIAGFLEAAHGSFAPIDAPASEYAPIVIPSYNGSRQMANLTPLLACLLARAGAPVLIHGVQTDPGRVTTAEILQAMGQAPAAGLADAWRLWADGKPAFMPVENLVPKMARLLAMRRILGVRNSTHTLVKLLQPFVQPALRLNSYTHPEYLAMLTEYLATLAPSDMGDVFLMRGTEGEAVANIRRAQQITWFRAGQSTVLVEREEPNDVVPNLPPADAAATAAWIAAVLRGEQAVPPAIAEQAEHCLRVARQLKVHA